MRKAVKCAFIAQPGFESLAPASFEPGHSALQLKPRTLLICVAAGIIFPSRIVFGILSAALGWSALIRKLNPFDAPYNHMIGKRRALFPLDQRHRRGEPLGAMAGPFALVFALLIQVGFTVADYVRTHGNFPGGHAATGSEGFLPKFVC